jgi:outer membrane protein
MRRSWLLAGAGLCLAPLPGIGLAQTLPSIGPIVPDMVGPVREADPGPLTYEPAIPEGTPAEIAQIDLASPVSSLTDALRRVYWFNPALLAERASLRAADFRLPQARAQFGPTLSYSLTSGWQRNSIDQASGTPFVRSGHANTAAAILNQPLYTFGRLAANERGARAQIAFQRSSLRNAEQQVLFAAISAYVGVLRDRAGHDIARDNLELLERQLRDSRTRFSVREITTADIEQVETRVAFARAQMLTAQTALATSEASFRSVVGSPAGTLAPPNPLQFPASSLDGAVAYAESNNPVLDAARAREKASRAVLDGAKAARMPRIDFQGRADFGTVSPYSNETRQETLLGQVVLSGTIYDNGLLHARQQEAEAANDADWRLIDNGARELRANVAASWSAKQTGREVVTHLADAVAAARKAYDGAQIQQKAGFRTTLDVLDLARELLTVSNNYNNSVADAYLAEARLLLTLGAMEQDYLLPDDPRHDPVRHLEKIDTHGDVPVATPFLLGFDGLFYGIGEDRPLRDPALPPAGSTGEAEAP